MASAAGASPTVNKSILRLFFYCAQGLDGEFAVIDIKKAFLQAPASTHGEDAVPRCYKFDGFTAAITPHFREKSVRDAMLEEMSKHVRKETGLLNITFREKSNRLTEEDKRKLATRDPKPVDEELLKLLVPAWAEHFFNKASGAYHHHPAAQTVWDACKAAGLHLAMTAGPKGEVYMFKTHRWEPLDETTDHAVLCGLIHKVLNSGFSRFCTDYNKKLDALEDWIADAKRRKEDCEVAEATAERRTFKREAGPRAKCAFLVQDNPWKQSVAKDLRSIIKSEDGSVEFNTKRHLYGLPNGVYDLHANQLRAGRPEDHITMCAGVEYVPWDSLPQAEKDRFLTFWDDLFEDKEVGEALRAALASSLYGRCVSRHFYVLFEREVAPSPASQNHEWYLRLCHARGYAERGCLGQEEPQRPLRRARLDHGPAGAVGLGI